MQGELSVFTSATPLTLIWQVDRTPTVQALENKRLVEDLLIVEEATRGRGIVKRGT
jgi:hypothetical protein